MSVIWVASASWDVERLSFELFVQVNLRCRTFVIWVASAGQFGMQSACR